MSRKDQLPRILAALDAHFADDDISPADADRRRGVKRHITRMHGSLSLVATSIAKMRELGMPLTDEEMRKIEVFARFRLGVTDNEP